jgi:hypothetical protein
MQQAGQRFDRVTVPKPPDFDAVHVTVLRLLESRVEVLGMGLLRYGVWCCLLVTSCGSGKLGARCGEGTFERDGECLPESANGGSAGTGGDPISAGTAAGAEGGAPSDTGVCPSPAVLTADDTLIEDFEAGATHWYGAADTTGMVTGTAFAGGATESNEGEINDGVAAAHVQGTGFESWGVGLSYQSWIGGCVDLSAFTGVSFWARGGPGTGDTVFATLSVDIPIPATQQDTYGGECTVNCLDHYKHLVELTEEWQEFTIEWSALAQTGWGTPADFTPERVQSIQFAMSGAAGGRDFDWWLDNIQLLPE